MTILQLNCDMGERQCGDATDYAILPHVDAINIALGGHAGDRPTARDLFHRANDLGISVHLHPGYPDKESFGRRVLSLSESDLVKALDAQREVLPEVASCKFHGALYNQAHSDVDLAGVLVRWMLSRGINRLVTMPDGVITPLAEAAGITISNEGFADRAYCQQEGKLALQPRSSALVCWQASPRFSNGCGISDKVGYDW